MKDIAIGIPRIFGSYLAPRVFAIFLPGLPGHNAIPYMKISLLAGDQINFGERYPHLKLCNITTKSDLEQKTFNNNWNSSRMP